MAEEMATMDGEDLSAYFLKQYRQKLLPLLRKLSPTEEDYLTPFIHLQEKKKQAQLMQKALEEKEEAFKERMQVITHRWRVHHTKMAQMKIYMEKSEKILKQENQMPIQALKKDSKERLRMMQKESELLRAKRQLEPLRNKHQKLRNKMQKYSTFNRYLEDVVKTSPFEEIQEVIWHYKTLMRMHKDLLQTQQGHKEMSGKAKVLQDQYTAEKEAEIQQYKNELTELQLRFDKAQKDVFLQEMCWARIQDTTAKKTQKLGTINMAILSLFQSVSMQLESNLNVLEDDSDGQLTMGGPSQTPVPCPENGEVMTLSCPKEGESPEKSMCPIDTFLFNLGALLGMVNGRRTPGKPVLSEEVEQGMGAGVGDRQAGAEDTDQPMAKVWFH